MRESRKKDGTLVINVSNRDSGLGTERLRSTARKYTLEDVRAYHAKHVDFLRLSIQTPYYHYTLSESTVPPEQRPFLNHSFLNWFWHTAMPIVDKFGDAQVELNSFGKERKSVHPDAETFLEAGEFVLGRSYTIENAARAFVAAPATEPKGKDGHTPLMLEYARIYIRELGTEKDPAIIEAMRRFIPRWLTHPLPAVEVDGEPQPWIPFTQKQAGYLVDQEAIDQGKAPLLIAMRSADRAEAEGETDKSYAMRTNAVISLLEMEREKAKLTENAEVPFFTFIMGGILAGANHEAPKDARYNYASALAETMRDTFERYQHEKVLGLPAQATAFLEKLATFYPDAFPELLAVAMVDADRMYDGVNLVKLIKGLETENAEWVAPTISTLEELGARRVLWNEEITEAVEGLPDVPKSGILQPETIIEDVSMVLGSADMFSFRSRLPQIGNSNNAVKYDVDIDLNRMSETIDARVSFTDDLGTRYLPFSLSFSGESESLEFNILDTETIDPAHSDRLRSVVTTLIHNRAEEIKSRRSRKVRAGARTADTEEEVADPLRIQTLSRDERLALYEQEKQRTQTLPGKKRSRTTVLDSAEAAQATAEGDTSSIVIENLTEQQIQALLAEERIQRVSPQNLVDKIRKMAIYAGQTRRAFGKKLDTRPSDVDLRELKFASEGGTALRVYLEATGGGTFVIQSILLKKGNNTQSKDIQKLITKIKSQQNTAESEG